MSLHATGERLVEERGGSGSSYVISLMHTAAYRFAMPFATANRVLDYGCGAGYGAARLAKIASTVDAVDVAQEAIAHARRQFNGNNLRFHHVPPDAPLPFARETFDVVLSFQVFEHVTLVDRYLGEARRVLAPGGCLLLVTPDRTHRLFAGQKPWNRWHVREYDRRSLAVILRKHFAEVDVQTMSGRPEVIEVELRRWRRMKWLALPFTLPLYPDRIRVQLLNLIHALRPQRAPAEADAPYVFDESAIEIGPGLQPSLNLVAIARA
jgi:SAM-dependent methyltransferase